MRGLAFYATSTTLPATPAATPPVGGAPGYGTVTAPANSIAWRNIPHASFIVWAFDNATETNPANAVAQSAVIPALDVDLWSAGNTTQNAWVVFELSDMNLPAGDVYLRIQAVNSPNFPVVGQAGLMWGVDSPISTQFVALPSLYSITANAQVPGGTLVPSTRGALPGMTVHLTAAPDAGWYFVSGSVVSTPNGLVNQATMEFVMPAENVQVSAEFMSLPAGAYAIVIDPAAVVHGSIVPSVQRAATNPQPPTGTSPSPWYAFPGDTVTLTVTPDTGWRYVADSILVNGTIPVSAPYYSFTMPAATALITAEFEQIPAPPPPPGGGGPGGGPSQTPPTLPAEEVTPGVVSEEDAQRAADAAEALAEDAADRWGATIETVGPAIYVPLENDVPTVETLVDLPYALDTSKVTTMARLNEDGTLTPVPTRIDAHGNIVVLLTESSILVPLNVTASFNDLIHVNFNVQQEIERAASLLIVEGFGDGSFRPGVDVTVQQAVTMFLRATGIPVEWATAMATGLAHEFISEGMNPTAPMTRMDAAHLIVNALAHFGLNFNLSYDQIVTHLADFTDVDGLTAYEREVLAVTVKLGIFRGFGDGTLRPGDILNRSQMASLAVRLQDVLLGNI